MSATVMSRPHSYAAVLFRLGLLSLLLAGCASKPPLHREPPSDTQADARKAVVETAQRMLGTPYRRGGSSPRGFDCSGLVLYSHAHAGIQVPRSAAEQYTLSRRIGRQQMRPGDLVFFNTEGRKISHVGIFVGDGQFVHAPGSGKVVSLESLDNPYWRRRIIGAGNYF